MDGAIWVFADSTSAGRELVTLGHQLGGPLAVFTTEPSVAADGAGLGPAVVYQVDPGDGLAGPAVAVAMASSGAAGMPGLVLFPTSNDGRDAAGWLSARWDRPVLTNAQALAFEDAMLVVTTSTGGGETLVKTAFAGEPPWLVAMRPRALDVRALDVRAAGGSASPAPVVELSPTPVPGRARVVSRFLEEPSGPALEDAQVVVAGGRGLGSPEAFLLVAELARLLGGAPGASRAVVDAGWVPYAWQVGQTGKTVAPTLYLAFGVSGASQHVAGMAGARHVVAVNKDRNAPLLGLADLAIVGDATQLLPRLIQALKDRKC